MIEASDSTQEQSGKPKFYPLVPVVLPAAVQSTDEVEPNETISQLGDLDAPLLELELEAEAETETEADSWSASDLQSQKPENESLFDVSPSLVESHTASIFIEELPESKNLSHVLETGEILTTGAIDISMLTANTNEIATQEAELADASLSSDAILGNVSSIAPLRATQVSYFGSDVTVLPSKLRRGEGQLYIALTVSISLVATGALVLAGYMLDLIK